MLDPVQQALLQMDLDKLDRAIASGVKVVESHTQGRIEYRNMNDMLAARSILVGRIDGVSDQVRTRRIVVTGRSGF